MRRDPRPGEVPLKAFVADESAARGKSQSRVRQMVRNGNYPGIRVRWVNARVQFVDLASVRGPVALKRGRKRRVK